MDKEEQQQKPLDDEVLNNNIEDKSTDEIKVKTESEAKEKNQEKEITPEDKIRELEDKLARTFAEMENQRRRFEKEKEDAFEYGGTSFAKEALNLIDNLERSKQVLKNDDKLKNSEALNKTLEHLDIINKDLISIFSKNDIKPIDCLNKKLDPSVLILFWQFTISTLDELAIVSNQHLSMEMFLLRLMHLSSIKLQKNTDINSVSENPVIDKEINNQSKPIDQIKNIYQEEKSKPEIRKEIKSEKKISRKVT